MSPNKCSRYAKFSFLSSIGVIASGSFFLLTPESLEVVLERTLLIKVSGEQRPKMSIDYKSKVTSSLMHCSLVSCVVLCTAQWQFGYPSLLFLTELSWDKLGFHVISQRPSEVPSPCLTVCVSACPKQQIWAQMA